MAEKNAVVKHVAGVTFAARTNSNHWIMMDGPKEFGGSDAATRPKELLLVALGGCTGSDVASMMEKRRVKLDNFEIHVTAQETEEHPKVFSSMHVEYIFRGAEILIKDVERAIELSLTKYCGVTAMFSKAMTITHSYRIEKE